VPQLRRRTTGGTCDTLAMPTRTIALDAPLDLRLTLAPLWRGRGDPTMRMGFDGVWRATRTPDGPGTIHLAQRGTTLRVDAWGDGAGWLIDHAPDLAGLGDDPTALRTDQPLIRDLARRNPGLRFPRTLAVFEALVPAIVEQKVTAGEAHRAWRGLAIAHGEQAPGPAGAAGLRVPPAAAILAALPYFGFHPFGLERRRAETIRRAALDARRLEATTGLSSGDAQARLRAIPGIGPWTAAEVAARAWGDPDAVSLGDFHLPSLVSWALAGEPRGTDDRMLELLAPYAGQRGRVIRLLEVSGLGAPRRGPRYAGRRIEAL
jgi:3-methyladenine DNA glycosylase/8-oxoguanine DNA glycosylase